MVVVLYIKIVNLKFIIILISMMLMLDVIPAVHRDLRIRYLDEIYHLISLIYYAAYNKGNIRRCS